MRPVTRAVVAVIAVACLVTAVVIAASGGLRPAAAPQTAAVTTPSSSPSSVPSSTPVSAASAAPVASPTPSAWDVALAKAQSLPLEVAAGQVIMADVSSPDPEAAARLVRSRHLAGVILMGAAITDADGVTALTGALAAADREREWPVIIATDEEGGTVQRLSPVIGHVSAFMAAGANGDAAQIEAYYAGLGAQMAQLGFTMDFAPVADVTIGTKDPTIRTRSAGSHPDAVAGVVTSAWQGLASGGVTPVIKHFPGHGSVTTDSHTGLPVQSASLAKLAKRDMVPFATAIEDGVPAVMMGHIRVTAWGKAPATVNPRAYAYLRDTLGFDGLIVTDAMNMAAITDRYSGGKAAVLALAAGADLVLMPAHLDASIAGIVAAVEDGTLSRERLDDAVAHVIVASAAVSSAATGAVQPQRPQEFVEGSIVVAAKSCGALIGDEVRIVGGTTAQRSTLAGELKARGVTVGDAGTSILLVGGDRGHGTADVVVATGGPWGLADSHATAYVATWGTGAAQMRALAAVLAGDVAPRGTWPVGLSLPYTACT